MVLRIIIWVLKVKRRSYGDYLKGRNGPGRLCLGVETLIVRYRKHILSL